MAREKGALEGMNSETDLKTSAEIQKQLLLVTGGRDS